jgi:hypothetical protein
MVPTGTASARRVDELCESMHRAFTNMNEKMDRIIDLFSHGYTLRFRIMDKTPRTFKPRVFIKKEEYSSSDSEDEDDESGYDSDDNVDHHCKVYPIDESIYPVASDCFRGKEMDINISCTSNVMAEVGIALTTNMLLSQQLLSERIDCFKSPLVLFIKNLNNIIAILLFRMQLFHLLLLKQSQLYFNYEYL